MKISSVPEFLGFSYSTPARVAFENAAVYKKKRKNKPRLLNPCVETESLKAKENSSLRWKPNL